MTSSPQMEGSQYLHTKKSFYRPGAPLAISACGFRYVIHGLLRVGLKGFHSSEPQNFVGSAEPMEPTLTGPLRILIQF